MKKKNIVFALCLIFALGFLFMPQEGRNAEAASTNAEVLAKSRTYRTDIQSEASGRQGVKLKNNGDYVEFTLQKPDIF